MATVSEHSEAIDGLPVFWRSAPAPASDAGSSPAAPIVYLHGVPTSSHIWLEFLRRGGGIAVDLPGFGRTGKPGHLPYDLDFYDNWIERFLDALGIERLSLVVQDWGALGLLFAQRRPERIERLVVIDAVPLLHGYRWHRTARLWRTPLVGELAMGATTPWVLRRGLSSALAGNALVPEEFLGPVIDAFDQGTQRAILRLYRSADPQRLASAGSQLGRIEAPALVVWGERDPYIPARFADAYAQALPNATLLRLPGAGHWCWLDSPEVVPRVVEFAGAR